MKKGNLLILNAGLERIINLTKNSKNLSLKHKLLNNKNVINEECGILKKLDNVSEYYMEFERKRIELAKNNSMKDGKPVMKDNHYIIQDENKEAFDEEFKKLESEYKDAIEERKEQIDNYNKYMNEESDFNVEKLKKIKLSDLEKEEALVNSDNLELLNSLLCIIED